MPLWVFTLGVGGSSSKTQPEVQTLPPGALKATLPPREDPLHGWSFLAEGYRQTDPGFADRVSVPVLWDTREGVIVSNESQDIVRAFNADFQELAGHPERQQRRLPRGFARSQEA